MSPQEVFWANYLGALALLIGNVYPAGRVADPARPRLEFHAEWSSGLGKKGLLEGVRLAVKCRREDAMTTPLAMNPCVKEVEGVGKKKNRIGGRELGYGVPIDVEISRVLD